MIRRDELITAGQRKGLPLGNAEKDYLLELLLYTISRRARAALVFKGGTALYKLHGLNRFSEDLDFTLVARRFDVEKCVLSCLADLRLLDLDVHLKSIERYHNEINVKLYFKGPLYDGRKESLAFIALNISLRERPLRHVKTEFLVTTYREIPSFNVTVMDLSEMLAEKCRAILTRNKPRDVYDMWFLLKKGLRPEIALVDRKLKSYKMRFSRDHFIRKIENMGSLWETDLRGLIIGELPAFEKVKAEVIAAIK